MPPLVAALLLLSPVIYIMGRWKLPAARTLTLLAFSGVWILQIFVLRDFSGKVASASIIQGMITFRFDGLSLLLTSLVLFLGILVAVYSGPDINGHKNEEKYYAMLLLLTGSVIGLVCASDLFNLWLWFEMTAISSYLLVAFYRERREALAACAKYLIQTATGSIVVLFAIVLIFAHSGSLDLTQIFVSDAPFMAVAGVLLIFGFGVKTALFPNYTWLPDAYAQAPTGISALLSGVVTITGLASLLRVLAVLDSLGEVWGVVLIVFGSSNIMIGNLLALQQEEVKRIFAYSSISHIGFIAIAVGVGLYAHQLTGFSSAMLHLFNHAIIKALAFLAVGTVVHTKFNRVQSLRVDDLKGLAKHDPMMAFALVIACLSLVGIPPLAGFISKLQIFAAGLETHNPTLVFLMVFVALNSVFSLAYYVPIVTALFQSNIHPVVCKAPLAMRFPVLILTVGSIVLGIAPEFLNGLIIPGSEALMYLFGG